MYWICWGVCWWFLENIEEVIPPSRCTISFLIVWYCDIQSRHGNMTCPYQLQDQWGRFFNQEGETSTSTSHRLMLLVWTWYWLNVTILQVTDSSRVRVSAVGGLWCLEMLKQLLLVTACLKTTQSNWPNEWETLIWGMII